MASHKIPETVVADPDALSTCKDADILVFVVQHAFVALIFQPLKGLIKSNAIGISLIKGFGETSGGGIKLISDVIRKI
jgi:glycerol-3-phosphate dehydrogenase (NAD+)